MVTAMRVPFHSGGVQLQVVQQDAPRLGDFIQVHDVDAIATTAYSTPRHCLEPCTHSTAQHSTGQHSTAQHSTAQHSTKVSLTLPKRRNRRWRRRREWFQGARLKCTRRRRAWRTARSKPTPGWQLQTTPPSCQRTSSWELSVSVVRLQTSNFNWHHSSRFRLHHDDCSKARTVTVDEYYH